MHQNYFICNGKKYYTGTIFYIKYKGKPTKATFICYLPEYNDYVYKIKEHKIFEDYKSFSGNFVSVTNEKNEMINAPQTKALKDRHVSGLMVGWTWYVFLMAIATIFKGNVILWAFISIVFFKWRKKKIKKEGTYIEW